MLAVLLFLQLFYLSVANAVLASGVIQREVNKSEGFLLELGSAYSLWPGHVHVQRLLLRFEDYNVQFQLTLDRVDVDISLTELPFKKFHVTKLRGDGTSFRMRHKLIVVGEDAERVAAYPPIAGFADPPYFVGVPSPPISDADYDLWQVRIEDVDVGVSELWVMEQRFRGHGVARGSFTIKPARLVQVEPAELVLERGQLTLGEHVVARRVTGRLTCSIPNYLVQELEGSQVFRAVSASAKLTLDAGQLDFLQAYLERVVPLRHRGAASWVVDARAERGIIQPGSRLELRAPGWRAASRDLEFSGPLSVVLERGAKSPREQLELAWRAPRIDARRAESSLPAPHLEGVTGELHLNAIDLSRPMSLGEARASVTRLFAPALAWFELPGAKLAGSADAGFDLARAADGALSGSARLATTGGRFESKDFAVEADVKGELELARRAEVGAPLRFNRLSVEASRCRLRTGERRSQPFSASVNAAGLELALGDPPQAQGLLRARVSSTEALLPLFTSKTVSGAGNVLWDLGHLDARANVKVAASGFQVTGLEARDGALRLHGHVEKRRGPPRGAFLVSSGMLNVGVTLRGGETEISPLVSDDWLANATAP